MEKIFDDLKIEIDSIIESFKNEIQKDLQIDQINLLEKQMELPAIKHKWVARMIINKNNKNKIIRHKKKLKKQIFDQLVQKNSELPKKVIETKINDSEQFQKFDEMLEDYDIVIEYLERIEKICDKVSFDLKNICDIIKLEEQ